MRREYADWFARIAEWKAKYPYNSYKTKLNHVQPQFVMQTLSRLTGGNAVIVPGVGQHQMWAGAVLRLQFPAPAADFGWTRRDGVRAPGGDGG